MMRKNRVNVTGHSSLCFWLYLNRTCYTVFLYTDLEAWYHRSHTELKGKSIKLFQRVRRQRHAWIVSPDADGPSPKMWADFYCCDAFERRQGGILAVRFRVVSNTWGNVSAYKHSREEAISKNHSEPLSPLKGKHTFWKSCRKSSPKSELKY